MWTYIAAAFGSTAIFLCAFGAHGLASRVTPERLANWHTAATYHLLHAVALLALALYAKATGRSITLPATLFSVGIVCFSGSIYLLVLTGQKWLGPITPLGGLAMAIGWISLIAVARAG